MSQSTKVDLVGVGLNATDTVVSVEKFPARGSKVEFHAVNVLPGGQTASAVVACQRWGMSTRYVGKVGDDAAASLHREAFDAVGVDAQLVPVTNCASQQSMIILDATGERTVLHKRDERLTLLPANLKREWIENARFLHVDGWDTEAAALAAAWAREAGVLVSCDLDDTYPGVEDLIRNVDYLIVNEDFPCKLTGIDDIAAALKEMHRWFPCKLAASTLGHHGAVAWDGESMHYCAAFKVPVVDTTGAGDTFRAGFIYGLHQGWPLAKQLDFASGAAALNCTVLGARGGRKTVQMIEDLIANGERFPRPAHLAAL
ncbi:MAG: carbohydrate kinase family protein [Acidobacteria bacterium]|nr:carbohydrate kinase family protein [Acidobacteriota bacterium]